jgi:Calcineurin-like phosphoesterase
VTTHDRSLSTPWYALCAVLSACGRDVTPQFGDYATPSGETPSGGDSGPDDDPCKRTLTAPSLAEVPTVPPFVQLLSPTSARLRFETTSDVLLPVLLLREGAPCALETEPTRNGQKLDFRFPDTGASEQPEHRDLPGLHVLHEVLLEDLSPGETVGWEVEIGGAAVLDGSFRVPPAPGGSFTAVFVGDTQAPTSASVFDAAAMAQADVWLHGGDIQYQSNDLDTWSGFFWYAQPLTALSPVHFALGNHELEGQDEFTVQWERLIAGPGDAGTTRYHAFTWGDVRFVALDTEEGLEDLFSDQAVFLAAELARVAEDPDLACLVPYFHRPAWTLGNHAPRTDIRAVLDTLFAGQPVPLVLQAHNHSYERFIVEGGAGSVTWVVDGGGGAGLYDVDDNVENYPDELAYRAYAEESHGFTSLRFSAGCAIELKRYVLDGTVVDSASIPGR